MKTFHRIFLLLSFLAISVFFKMDIQSEYILPIWASSVFATSIYHDGFNDIIVGHHVGWGITLQQLP